ncbi:MAG: Ig-like domain-containing protein [Lachnospiraceae bacterium]|nr:Ig-like domain-containing protein [Lachnospiraceae bacterium]
MFYKKFGKLLSVLMCTTICIGSPAITSLAETLNAETSIESSDLQEISSEYSTLEESPSSESSSDEPSMPESSSVEETPSEAITTESSSSDDTSIEEIMTETAEEETTEELPTEDLPTEELPTEEQTTEEILSDDEQLLAKMNDAVDAFHMLLREKQFMALLYHTDSYDIQRYAGSYNDSVSTIKSGHTLYITGIELLDDQVWYQVSFWLNGEEQTGYIEGYYLAYSDEDWIAWERAYLADIYPTSTTYGITAYSDVTGRADTSDIAAFPALYHESLRTLKEQHPTWTFVPMYTGLDFNTAVSNEMGAKSLIQNTSSNAAKGWVGSACPTESGWYYATKPAVIHYMNPCNFLTENYIFQFEQLTFNSSYHNVSAIQTFLNNTFMKGKIPSDASGRTYAQAFFEIGKNRKLSPIHLASRVYQEQGSGTSALISGTYKGFEGYYNYFNVGVNGSSTEEKIRKGLTYAKSRGWNTRFKSLEGGAATIGNNYILKGQDTIYLEKFNVDVNSPHGLYNHQYMQNIQAPASESSSTRRMYAGAGSLDSGFVFKIPVYQNMPGEKPIKSITLDKTEVVLYRPDTIVGNTSGYSSTAALSVSINPSDTTDDKTITWTSSNPKAVSVKAGENTQTAVITALAAGDFTITARSQNNKTAQCKVHVEAPIYSLRLTNLNAENDIPDTSATIYAGQSFTLTADYLPKDTTSDTNIIWASSAPSVASVDSGKVTAHKKGTATITATVAGFSASYDIIVSECTVRFVDSNGQTLKTVSARYGSSIPKGDFPQIDSTAEKQFIGWYTKKNGQGTQFDESTLVYENDIVLYPYFEEQGKGFYVIPVGDKTYTGAPIKPEVHVYDSIYDADDGSYELIKLIQGQDYTVTYKNNKDVNTSANKVPTITVKGKGNYSGTDSVTFNILPKPLTDHDITVNNVSTAYNGKVQKASPAVYRDGKKLTNKKDYTLTYPYENSGAYKNAGVYPIVIKGIKNYSGTITVYETISKKTMLSKVSVAKIPNQTYKNELVDKASGKGIIPDKLTVTYKNQTLIASTDGGKTGDYTVSYANNMAIGTATVTITATAGSSYAGSKSINYKIVGTNINTAKVAGITSKTYTGNEADVLQNNLTLTLNNTVLRESKDNGVTGDYTVSYINTSNAGTATVILKGINAYSGQIKKTYKIAGFDITDTSDITMLYATEDNPSKLIPVNNLSEIRSPYMKGGAKPQVKLYYRGTALTAGKDYTISYSNNTSVTTSETPENRLPKITIKGKGNFIGSIQGTWIITDGAMSPDKLSMSAKDISYKSKPNSHKTTVTITDANGKKLTAGKDYDKNIVYTYAGETQVTTADGSTIRRKKGDTVDTNDIISADTSIQVTVKGIGAYLGDGSAELSTTYRIIATDISKAKLKVNAKEYLNGKSVKLDPTDIELTLNGSKLVHGTDYIIDESTYANNTKKGKATVILRGTGKNFGGQRKITFTIGSKLLIWWKNLT